MSKKTLISLHGRALVLALTFLLNGTLMTTTSWSADNWQKEWQGILKAAQKEGAVAVFGGSTVGVLKKSANLFKEKFGVNLHTLAASGDELTTRILRERQAGLYTQDVMITGHTSMLNELKPTGAFDPMDTMLVLPEVVNKKLWLDGRFDWADTQGRYLFNFTYYPYHMVAINTDLVKPGEIKSYYDLLDPKWKGKIIINDPTVNGMANTEFSAMLYNKLVDADFFRRLVAQGHLMSRDQNLQVDWMARGKYPIVLWPSLGRLESYINAGAPIKIIDDIKEGTAAGSTGSALSLMNRAPHPNAAKVFINWFLSKEGQAISQKAVAKQTRRIDVDPEGLSPFQIRKPGVRYFPSPGEQEEFSLNEVKKHKALAEELFGPLKK